MLYYLVLIATYYMYMDACCNLHGHCADRIAEKWRRLLRSSIY